MCFWRGAQANFAPAAFCILYRPSLPGQLVSLLSRPVF
jgi:hypothetical protein